MRRVVLCLALAILLAGCADKPTGSAGAPPGGTADVPGPATGTGVLRVLVVDPAIRPLANTRVELNGTSAFLLTDAGGEARFTGLAPGLYVVVGRHAGYFDAKTTGTVSEGDAEPKPVVLSMAVDNSMVAYVQATQEDIFVDAAFSIGADASGDVLRVSAGGVSVPLPDGIPAFVQSEASWQSTQALGTEMDITFFVCPNQGTLCENIAGNPGPSPVHVSTNATALVDLGYVADGDLSAPLWAIHPSPGGAGLILEQQVRVTTHRFYGFLPPDGWLFSRDGEPTPPA